MASPNNPLPPCPVTPNCIRTYKRFKYKAEELSERITRILNNEAFSYHIVDPKRIEIHAVYRIPLFGFKDDVDLILEESGEHTILFIRSASRLGAYDLGVNKRRVKRIFRKIEIGI